MHEWMEMNVGGWLEMCGMGMGYGVWGMGEWILHITNANAVQYTFDRMNIK